LFENTHSIANTDCVFHHLLLLKSTTKTNATERLIHEYEFKLKESCNAD